MVQADPYPYVTEPLYKTFLYQLEFPRCKLTDQHIQNIFSNLDFKDISAYFSTCKSANLWRRRACSIAIRENSLLNSPYLMSYLKTATILCQALWGSFRDCALRVKNLQIMACIVQNPSLPLYHAYWTLQWAIREGHLPIVELVLQRSDIDFTNKEGLATLQAAIFKKDLAIFKCLLKDQRVDPSFNEGEILCFAAVHRFMEAVELMLDHSKVNPHVQDQKVLKFAIMHKHLPTIRKFLSYPSTDGRGLIGLAVESKKVEILKLILQFPYADPIEANCYGFLKAVEKGYTNMIDCFLQDERFDLKEPV